jgi:hypothetical protein
VKYTKELLEPIVAKCISMAGVIKTLGLRQSGGNHSHLKRVIEKFEISTNHFLGSRANQGPNHKGGPDKKLPEEYLVLRREDQPRTHGKKLRRALVESGVEDKCNKCGILPVWNGKPLVLTPDHRNGKFWDNRKENLELLCPNCHSQTDTFSGRNNGS